MGRIKSFFTKSLRNKLILTTVLVALLALIIMSAYAVWVTSSALSKQASREQAVELDSLRQGITGFLAGLEQDVIFLSQSQTLAQYLNAINESDDPQAVAQKREAVLKEFLAFSQARKVYDQVRFLDAKGNEVVRVNTDSEGKSYVVPHKNLQNKAGRYYFTDSMAVAPGSIFVSPLDLNVEQGQVEILPDGSNKPVIRYGTPVILDGEVVGVIVTNVLAKNFLSLLQNSDSVVFLVDEDGYYLYHPDEEKRWGRDLGTEIKLGDDYSAVTEQTLLLEKQGTFIGEGQFFAHQPVSVPGYSDISWYLGKVQPQQAVFEPVINFVYGAVIVAIIALIVAIVAAIIIDRAIARPLVELNEAAIRVAGGDYDVEIAPGTEDEIGTLAQAFNIMSNHVRELVEDLEDRVQRKTRALEAGAVISRHISTVLDVGQLLQEVVYQIQHTFGYYHVHIYLIDNKTGELVMREGTGSIGQQMKEKGHTLQIGQGIVGSAAQRGAPILAEDVNETPEFFRNPLLPKTQSELAVPIKKGDVVLGVLDMQGKEAGAFSEADLTLMNSIANQIVVAIDNARLFREMQASVEEAGQLSRQVTRDMWRVVGEQAQISGLAYSSEGIVSSSSDWLPEMEQAVRQNHLVKSLDNRNGGGDESCVAIPLMLRDEVIGVISIERPTDQKWSEDELVTIQSIAGQVALALDAARLSLETERAAWRDHMVSETTATVWSSAEIEDVMRAAVAQLGNKLQASEVVIRLGTETELQQD